jgi:fatty-acid desaturase
MKLKPIQFFQNLEFSHRSSFGGIALLVFICALIAGISTGLSWWWAAAYVVHFFLFTFGVGFGLHRGVAHQLPFHFLAIRNAACLIGVFSNVGSPLSWIVNHSNHHAYADEEKDPTNPEKLGWRVIIGATRQLAKNEVIQTLSKTRSARDPFLLFLHRYYYLIMGAFFAVMYMVGGIKALIFLALIPAGTSFISLGLLNYFTHGKLGYRNFSTMDESRNIWWLWPLTFGENWHNNHHHEPRGYSSRIRAFELDAISIYTLLFFKKAPD